MRGYCEENLGITSLQVSRDCVTFIKSLFSQVVAARAAT